jgi:hypothetical protein
MTTALVAVFLSLFNLHLHANLVSDQCRESAMSSAIRIACGITLCASLAQAHAATPLEHFGTCDASAAIAVGADLFLVGDDENQKLRLYRRDRSGPALPDAFDISAFLQMKPGDEADIEGAAQIGKRIYWISSHAYHAEPEKKHMRRQFFATDIDITQDKVKLTPVGASYTRLLDAMGKALQDASEIAAETKGGLNIEGLAATPEGHLLIGFRGPVKDKQALILRLQNPAAVVEQQAKPVFGPPVSLPLNGSGIRSIEYVAKLGAYLIIAGPEESEGAFKLYQWSGQDKAAPQLLPVALPAGLRPEALFALPDGKTLQLLSDDGDEFIGDKKCKKSKPAEQRKFRSFTITLPK